MDIIEIYEPYGFLYITTNLINGKKYVGAKIFDKRNSWKHYLGSGRAFLKAIEKYGKNNFKKTIVSIHYSKEELYEEEEKLINFLKAVNSKDYYNLSGGQYHNKWIDLSEEEKKIIIQKIKNKNFWNIASEEEKEKRKNFLSEKFSGNNNPFFGKRHTEETKYKMSNAKKGKYIGDDRFKYWEGKPSPLKGKKMSKESRKNMSNSAKRRIQNIGPPNCKPINIFFDNNKYYFPTINEAYVFCKSNNLILLNGKNMCKDTFKKRLNNNEKFSLFTYSFDGHVQK